MQDNLRFLSFSGSANEQPPAALATIQPRAVSPQQADTDCCASGSTDGQ